MRFARLTFILLASASLVGAAAAQAPVGQQPGGGDASAQAAVDPIQQDQEPARAPGSKGDEGKTLPATNANSGTTTSYAPSSEEKPVQWPCAQRKVPTITAATIWSGPNVAEGKGWDDDDTVAVLAQKLASRRTPLDAVEQEVQAFAKKAGPDKDKKLTELFVGVLDIINTNRDQILQGITRYARGQERLARRISDESDTISQSQSNATAAGLGVATDQKNTAFSWDKRIFKERKQALSYVCETPSLLERRAYEVGKRIQAQL